MEHYKVDNKVFETLAEAMAYANDYLRATKILLCIEETKRKVTHKYRV